MRRDLAALVPTEGSPTQARGLVLPHAGYVYSGATAGATVGAATLAERVILVGPKHTGLGAALAINTSGQWETPLGPVPVDVQLAAAVQRAIPELVHDEAAFAREHSLEVELPFLKWRQPALRLVPIALAGGLPVEACLRMGQALARVIEAFPHPVTLVASTDMHHQGMDDLPPGSTCQAEVQRKSGAALERLEAMDPGGLLRLCRRQHITMCGVQPTAIVMEACKALGAAVPERVAVTDSYAVRPGDGRYVVGYAGYLIRSLASGKA